MLDRLQPLKTRLVGGNLQRTYHGRQVEIAINKQIRNLEMKLRSLDIEIQAADKDVAVLKLRNWFSYSSDALFLSKIVKRIDFSKEVIIQESSVNQLRLRGVIL